MSVLTQDSAQQRVDSTTTTSTMVPPQRQGPPQNAGYLQAVYVQAILLFGGYWFLLHRRNAKLRDRQKSAGARR